MVVGRDGGTNCQGTYKPNGIKEDWYQLFHDRQECIIMRDAERSR